MNSTIKTISLALVLAVIGGNSFAMKKQRVSVDGNAPLIDDVRMSPCGNYLVANNNGIIKKWDIRTGKPIDEEGAAEERPSQSRVIRE